MSTTVNINRQTPLVAYRDFEYDDFVSGTAKNLINLPSGARVIRGFVDITSVFGPSTQTLVVGDSVGTQPTANKYLTSTNVTSTGVTALTTSVVGEAANGVLGTGGAWITGTLTSGSAATGGAGRLQVEYVIDDRVTEYHAYRG